MPERGKTVLLWALVILLLLFQTACLERQGENAVKYLGRVGVPAALIGSAGRHCHGALTDSI